jgi:hypothetical protein
MPYDARHVLRGSFDEARRLHATHVQSFLVNEEIAAAMRQRYARKIYCHAISVKDDPEDGLGRELDIWP